MCVYFPHKAVKNKRKRLKQRQAVLNDRIANYGGDAEKLREGRKLAKMLRQVHALGEVTDRPLGEAEKAKLARKGEIERKLVELDADFAAYTASNQDPRWAVYALFKFPPPFVRRGKNRLCVLDRHYAGSA